MTNPYRGPTRATSISVMCPVCRERIPWNDTPMQVVEWVSAGGHYSPVDLSAMSPNKQGLRRSECYVVCPASARTGDPLDHHHLPADYRRHGEPIVIGLVGRPKAGKTHLAVAMLAELFRGAGSAYHLTQVSAIDQRIHTIYETRMITPFRDGRRLQATVSGNQSYAESIQVMTPTGKRTIVFFDIAGDEFSGRTSGGTRDSEFLLIVDALLFVEAVDEVRTAGNEWIGGAQRVLEHVPAHTSLPAAIVLSKADQERYSEPLDRWLREPPLEGSLSGGFHDESRDVYAWLRDKEATYLLELVEALPLATLHVASATGGADDGAGFPRGVRPTRVVEPLAALLAGLGVLPDAQRRLRT